MLLKYKLNVQWKPKKKTKLKYLSINLFIYLFYLVFEVLDTLDVFADPAALGVDDLDAEDAEQDLVIKNR